MAPVSDSDTKILKLHGYIWKHSVSLYLRAILNSLLTG